MSNLIKILLDQSIIKKGTIINHAIKTQAFGTVSSIMKNDLMVVSHTETSVNCVDRSGTSHSVPMACIKWVEGMSINRFASVYGIYPERIRPLKRRKLKKVANQ